ncbi:MAG TPA: 50S ribosomal protein L11 methyltransferase, partial [Solirubrobacteraceae bacterium]|nr:50S ribosomal protein L11 methyltransferase [Solirubrobacteraceae bacterium]
CGSGVLAIAAARLGWGPVTAVDFDPVAVEAAASNASVNGVAIEVGRHDLRVDPVLVAPCVAANLLRPLLLTWASRLDGASELPERVIAGGLLVGEADEIAGAFGAVGLREVDRRDSGDWAALLLARPRYLGPRTPKFPPLASATGASDG